MTVITLPPVSWDSLDDAVPAGPYEKELDGVGMRLLCLAVIRQAVMDTDKNDEQGLCAQIWISENVRWWLRALGIARNWNNERVRGMVFGDCQQKMLRLDEEGEEYNGE